MDMQPHIAPSDYLNALHQRGIALLEQDGKVRYRAARGGLSEEDLHDIAARKADILPLLHQRGEAPDSLPLSRGQEALWFLARDQPWSTDYNVVVLVARFRARLDVKKMCGVYQTLLNRHPALRALFREKDGMPLQAIQPYQVLDFQEIDCAGCTEVELARRVAAAYRQPFILEFGPLFRVRLLRRAPDDVVLLVTAHQLVLDSWSIGRLSHEMLQLLDDPAAVLPPPGAGYDDFVRWQRGWMASPDAARSRAYWEARLAGELPLLDLPLDYPRRSRAEFTGASLPFTVSPPTLAGLRALARQYRCGLFSLLLGAFQVLLSRHSGQTDIITGTPVATRPLAEFHETVGNFSNPLAIRGDLSGNPTFRQFLEQIEGHVRDALAHHNLPFSDLTSRLPNHRTLRRDRGHSPVYQAAFALHAPPPLGAQGTFIGLMGAGETLEFSGLRAETYPLARHVGRFDIVLELVEDASTCPGLFKFNAELFQRASIERMAGHFALLLEGIVADPDCPVANLPLLSGTELRQMESWNATRVSYPATRTLHHQVEASVARHPNAPALAFAGATLSYAEMNHRANRLAHYLGNLDFAVGTPLGVCLPPGPERIIALLAVLKSGCAYLPLDADYPAERLEYMVEDARCAAVLCMAETRETLRGCHTCLLDLETLAESLAAQPGHNPHLDLSADGTAYVIYTSGSTGRPKGVPIQHHSVGNLARAQIRAFKVDTESRVLQFAAFSVDAAVSDIFMALCAGACLHLAPRAALLPGPALWQTLREQRISHLTLPPSALSVLPKEALPDLKHLILAGEAFPGDLAAYWQKGRHCYNAYGPTEATVCCTIMECTRLVAGPRPPPIGKPIANMRVHVLSEALQPVPIGVRGELYIGGVGLSRGYLNRPELNSGHFIESPFVPGQRLYRSGDLARWRDDGNLEFLGRIDHQVKVRGHRVETGEIEATLRADPEVADVVVLASPGPDGLPRLNAYLVPAAPVHDQLAFQHRLRTFLEAHLPRYMVPSGFVLLQALPLNPAGKVDHHALRGLSHEPHRPTTAPHVAPRDTTEQALAELWARLLGVETPGIHDDFFDLGGHSLLAAGLVNAIETTFGRKLRVDTLFEHATIAKLARLIAGHDAAATRSPLLLTLQGRGQKTPLYLVHALGGDVFDYHELAQSLGSGQPVHALRAPGLEAGETAIANLVELAGHHVRALRRQQPYGPYHLAGWSMGGVVAYEMARRLRSAGEEVAELLLFDSYPPQVLRLFKPDAPAAQLARDLGGLFGGKLKYDAAALPADPHQAVVVVLNQAQRQGFLPSHPDAAQLERLARLYLANLEALHGYLPGPYRGKLTLFRAAGTRGSLADNGWRGVCGHALKVYPVPGDHYTLLRQPYVRVLAATLNDYLHPLELDNTHGKPEHGAARLASDSRQR